MAGDSKSFPIRAAEKFARGKGLNDAVTHISRLKRLPGWEEDHLGYKKGMYIMLFCACGLFDDFKQKHWPQEGAPDNCHRKLVYIARALEYDEAVRKMCHSG